MCGLAGIAALSNVNRAAVQAMTDLMVHRGPDGEGLWLSADDRICFGHRRLSIIDLTDRAAQPMQDTTGTYTLTYNGEIYNFKEVRAELAALGAQFRSDSDTEVILEAYRAWGDDCLSRFNGMFAFALHDAKRNRILCARDRFGEKPFLFFSGAGFFAFASEYKALLTLECVRSEVNNSMFAQFFVTPSQSLDQERQTLFKDISQLLPGEKLVLNAQDLSFEITSYWQPPLGPNPTGLSETETIDIFRDLLQDSVRLRLRSDVPVGSCLSGGLDSGSITYLARELIGQHAKYDTFTGRFPESDADEGPWAEIISKVAGTQAHEVFPTGKKLVDTLDNFLWLNELPVDSTSQYAQWCVFEAAKDAGVTVLLDGQGGDEILAGYEQYFAPYLATYQKNNSDIAQEERVIRNRYPLALSTRDQRWKNHLPRGAKKFLSRTFGRGSSVLLALDAGVATQVREDAGTPPDDLHAALRKDAFSGFLTTLLRYGDRNSMAHSREVRLPFCDHRILEFVATLPAEMLMGSAQTKYVLRQAMGGILPESIVTRWHKQGFVPPITGWLRGDLRGLVETIFNDSSFNKTSIWDPVWCRRAWRRFRAGEAELAPTIWKILISECWLDRFLRKIAAMDKISPTM